MGLGPCQHAGRRDIERLGDALEGGDAVPAAGLGLVERLVGGLGQDGRTGMV